jgi:hypothetical protein
MYTDNPDGLASELAAYRAVTPSSSSAAVARWVTSSSMIEVQTEPL